MWSHEECHPLVDDVEDYLRAEDTMRQVLWGRGVTLHSGELQLAAAFVAAWLHDQPASDLPARLVRSQQDDVTAFASILWRAYPEVVRVATVLTRYTYQKLEKGESGPGSPANPRLMTLLAISQVLSVGLTDLLPAKAPDLTAR